MNVIVTNKYRDALAELDIEVIKKLEGEFSVEEIVDTFKNFFFQKMILDITALKNYKDIKTLQQLSLSLDMDRLVLLLDGSPETSDPEFLSDLISMHIYNFTMNVEGVKWLFEHPNSYRDVAQYHQLDTVHNVGGVVTSNGGAAVSSTPSVAMKKGIVICFKDATPGAGATTLVYLAKKQLSKNYKVAGIEVDKHDFMYLDDDQLESVNNSDLGNAISKHSDKDVILIDSNSNMAAEGLSNEVIYLIEPSKIMLNKAISKNPSLLSSLQNKKVVLNKCVLSSQDVSDFEFETKLKVFYTLPPLNDQSDSNKELDEFLSKLGFYKQDTDGGNSKKGFGLFK